MLPQIYKAKLYNNVIRFHILYFIFTELGGMLDFIIVTFNYFSIYLLSFLCKEILYTHLYIVLNVFTFC